VSEREDTISITMAADESYSVALGVAVHTLLENLHAGFRVDIYIMTANLPADTRRRLESVWGSRVRAHWICPDDRKVRALLAGTGHTARPSAYYRLLVGSCLPAALTKVIYLDVDVLVRGDISPLWQMEMNGNMVLAAQDSCIQANPWSGARNVARPYLNSGVMVIDLAAWRQEKLEERCVERARALRPVSKYNEQAALNECLAGRWGILSPVWNRQSTLDLFPDWQSSPYEAEEFRQASQNPIIVHFTTATKPWRRISDHSTPFTEAYRAAIVRAGWRDWQLPPLPASQRAVEFFARPHRRILHLGAALIQARRRAHAFPALLPEILEVTLLHPWTLFTVPLAVAREKVALWLVR
jgi:lipopolysaccharide biosynthesis glycosyltransferase